MRVNNISYDHVSIHSYDYRKPKVYFFKFMYREGAGFSDCNKILIGNWYLNWIWKRGYGMIANETTLHKKPNGTKINKYRSPYGLQQWAKPIPHGQQ